MKKFIKIVLFLFIFVILFIFIFRILWLEKTPIMYFYDEPKKYLDVVYVGSSNVYAHFNTTLAYNEYGFTTGLLSTDSQPFITIEYLIKESLKYQKPSLYVIDITKVSDDFRLIEDAHVRKTIDSMRFSKNRTEAIDELLKYTSVSDSVVPYYFSFLKYHNSWKNISKNNFTDRSDLYKGYLFSNYTIDIKPQNDYVWSNDVIKLNKDNREVLIKLIDYIRDNKLNVLFVVPRRSYRNNGSELNEAISIIKDNNLDVVNFNVLSDFDVDFDHDFYNEGHLNIYGATKYTLYFSEYLNDNYELKDHRNDKLYSSWNKEYQRFKNTFKSLIGYDFDKLLDEYKNVNY